MIMCGTFGFLAVYESIAVDYSLIGYIIFVR